MGAPVARRTIQRRHTETYGDAAPGSRDAVWGTAARGRVGRTFSIGSEVESGCTTPHSTIVEDEVGEIEAEVDLEDSDGPSGFDGGCLACVCICDGGQELHSMHGG